MGNVGGGHPQESGQRLVAELLAELARRVCEVGAEHVRVVTDEELERDRMRWFRAGWQEQAREARGARGARGAREAQEARGVGKVREVRASRGDRAIREVRGSREAHEAWQQDPGVRPAPGTPGSRPASGTSRPGPGPDPERERGDRGDRSGCNDRSDHRPHPATRTPDQAPTRGTGHPDTESPGTGHPGTGHPGTESPSAERPETGRPTPGSPPDPPASRARGLPEEPEHGPSRSRPARVLRFPESGGT
ncbi:hypothetical protein GPA10_03560 [Streptomyces sp. p1417]|uniref:Uncharacterized protein n=1 Tax=Streptomyces typhae TaxID=2681492 RepID=A0A6L6WNM5_9ACTN|nr:hypothetical protein [Streptomyces typhae]MVO83865.1 hypothetical protein [Streptomyces typhae]